ncbi:MAG TPA: hypothetical protein VNL18_07730 [Gemmatimonadales bacterium]|nr:hypothetical protein [Gemmatimonadales bacterium]
MSTSSEEHHLLQRGVHQNPGARERFVYDGLGRRQRKTIAGTATDFVYDGLNPVREATGGRITDLLTGLN